MVTVDGIASYLAYQVDSQLLKFLHDMRGIWIAWLPDDVCDTA